MPFSLKSFLKLTGALILLASSVGQTSQGLSIGDEIHAYDDNIGIEYYTITDPESSTHSHHRSLETIFDPSSMITNWLQETPSTNNEQNLLQWVYHKLDEVETPTKYKRELHFGTWIKDPSRQTCLNVRGLVLLRDAQGNITYADEKKCRITGAHWVDPYTQKDLYSAEEIQIDHVVPLKNAYVAGAWQWNYSKRCTYSNFLGNNFHLLPVLGTENNRKSDSSPDAYVPPSQEFVCQYLINWLKIKSIWQLKIGKREALGIQDALTKYHCDNSQFEMSAQDLEEQRSKSQEAPQNCQKDN